MDGRSIRLIHVFGVAILANIVAMIVWEKVLKREV